MSGPVARPDPRPLVIGLGNRHRGDDGAGVEAVRRLAARLGARADLVEDPGDVGRLLDLWEDRGRVFVVDAVRSGRPAGTVVRCAADSPAFPDAFGSTSSHGLSLGDAVALGRSLSRLPRELTVYGIEADSLRPGVGLSPAVARAAEEVAERIAVEIEDSVGSKRSSEPTEAPCTKPP